VLQLCALARIQIFLDLAHHLAMPTTTLERRVKAAYVTYSHTQ